jgi:predicted DCC family thiol-disulfide oxidoreductase YuxK
MHRILVIYDDECPLCSFQMRIVTWLDWFNQTAFIPASHPRAADWAKNVSRDELLGAIHCVRPNQRIDRGARCLRVVGMRIPLLVPFSLVLWVPGAIRVAERLYGWISRHRHGLSRMFGCKEACAVLPARRRTNEESLATPKWRNKSS